MSKIPHKKHAHDELSQMRAQGGIQVQNNNQIVDTYNKLRASKFLTVLGYALPFITIGWWIIKKAKAGRADYFEMLDFWIMTVPLVLALVIALWITVKHALSRHNAAFISIFCALCFFPVFTVVAGNDYLKEDLFALVGKEMPVASDPLLNSYETKDDLNSNFMTDEKREERKNLEEKLIRYKEEFIRKKKPGYINTTADSADSKIEAEDEIVQKAIKKAKAVLAAKKKREEAAAMALKRARQNIKAKSYSEENGSELLEEE